MSYDIYVEVDAGGAEPLEVYWRNYTSNVSGMWNAAMPEGLKGLDGMPAQDAIPILEKGIEAMRADPHRFRRMEPPNGWGTYEGALEVLEHLLGFLTANPGGTTISISR